jgi:hypothetical protein
LVRIETVTVIQAPMMRCFDLARSVEVHLLENVHGGMPAEAVGGVTSGLAAMGQQTIWQAKHFGVRQRLTNSVTGMDAPRYFQVTMIRGAFRSMQHDHYFRAQEDGGTEMRDVLNFAAPLPVLGWVAERMFLRRYMASLLQERCLVVKRVAESAEEWKQYVPPA